MDLKTIEGSPHTMRRFIHILVAIQIMVWAVYMTWAYLGPDERTPEQSLQGYLFVGVISLLLCFVPALRLSKTYEKQPIALILALLPILVMAGIFSYAKL